MYDINGIALARQTERDLAITRARRQGPHLRDLAGTAPRPGLWTWLRRWLDWGQTVAPGAGNQATGAPNPQPPAWSSHRPTNAPHFKPAPVPTCLLMTARHRRRAARHRRPAAARVTH